ncbi:MAG TPA: SemiSWEET transporter [Thermoplasmata archaeon]|nr:SemiSWEET transporter [Thermoplasmata archaeon]
MIPSDSLATLVGYVAAICTTGAFVPQVLRVWRLQSAQDISLTTFLVFSLGTVVWLVYGLLIDSLPVILANGVTLALALTIVALKLNFDRKVHRPPT